MVDLVSVAYKPKPSYRLPRGTLPNGNEGDQTANHANSTSPSSATLSNTAAGYTTLGGRYQFVPVAGAATDYALFAYQVPATHRFICNGVSISAVVSTVLVTTACILDWSLGLNSTAVSLATTDSAPAFGPRRLPLGTQGFIAVAAAGVQAPDVVRHFASPLIVEPGRYVHAILQTTLSTAGGLIRGDVMFDGWFEPTDSILNGG